MKAINLFSLNESARSELRTFLVNKSEAAVNISTTDKNFHNALEIFKILQNHGNVTVTFFGINDGASVLAGMGAQTRKMSENSFVKLPGTFAWSPQFENIEHGNLNDLANHLKRQPEGEKLGVTLMLAEMFADKTNCSAQKILSHMKAGQMLTAEEAKTINLVSEVVEPGNNTDEADDGVDWETLNSLPHMQEFL